MKEFMMIFIGAPDYESLGMSPEEIQGKMSQWWAWNSKMEEAGIVVSGEALRPEVRRIVGAQRTVTDVASAELKEIVGGYYIIKAESMDAVVEIAQDFPDYDLGGTVEIREVMVFEQ